MKAFQKFEKRLKDLGLYDEWCSMGEAGKVGIETEDGIIILVHEEEGDEYTEFTYPPMREMARDEDFRRRALNEFKEAGDEKFIRQLIWWFFYPEKNECPLFPVDVYFIWDVYRWEHFKDDEVTYSSEFIAEGKTAEWCPHCDEEVELDAELKVQKCPNCGKWIVACSMCPLKDCSEKCPLERMERILNGE